MMNIQILKNIGKSLFEAVGTLRLHQSTAVSIGKGAGGDHTFKIDKIAEDIAINSLLKTALPLTIISEESGVIVNGNDFIVLIDPIDGSKNAISGLPFYCASFAVSVNDEINGLFLGYVINLLTGDFFWAQKDKGFFFNDTAMKAFSEDVFRVIAFEAQNPAKDLMKFYPLLSQARRVRCLGAAALDMAYTAYGALSLFVSPPLRCLDFAAGYLLVKEAGGVVTDIQGRDLHDHKLGLTLRSSIFAASSKALHKNALDLLLKSDQDQ